MQLTVLHYISHASHTQHDTVRTARSFRCISFDTRRCRTHRRMYFTSRTQVCVLSYDTRSRSPCRARCVSFIVSIHCISYTLRCRSSCFVRSTRHASLYPTRYSSLTTGRTTQHTPTYHCHSHVRRTISTESTYTTTHTVHIPQTSSEHGINATTHTPSTVTFQTTQNKQALSVICVSHAAHTVHPPTDMLLSHTQEKKESAPLPYSLYVRATEHTPKHRHGTRHHASRTR